MAIRAILFLALTLMSAIPAHAECVTVAIDVPNDLKRSDLVVAGTVLAVEVDRLTFRPDRIWKGRPAGREIVIHLIGDPAVDSYTFRKGERYVFFARLLQPAERTFVADNSEAFGVYRPCGAPVWPLSVIPELDRAAHGRKP